jgi:enterochelin esterase-like enzyme
LPAKPGAGDQRGAGVRADDVSATFAVADPERALAGVRLLPDAPIPAGLLDFRRAGDFWRLSLARPPVWRLEYLLELRYQDGGAKVVTDPANPRQAPGAFGPKSVLEFPGYVPPSWLTAGADPGTGTVFGVTAPDRVIGVRTWSPSGVPADTPLPLLIAHDGPEYDALASLTRYLGAGVAGGWLPRLRAALLGPGQRNEWYSASPRYARALCRLVLPDLGSRLATTVRIGIGASLGGLAMLHAHCRHPGSFDGLFLQSGSFFAPRLDPQERPFPYFRRITAFTAGVQDGRWPGRPVPVVLTCGGLEENAGNNRSMAAALASHGYPASLHEVPDTHNYTAWRDAFDPYLTRLLQQAGRPGGPSSPATCPGSARRREPR